MPISKVKRGLADVLKREGYIWDWQEVEAAPAAQLRIELKYGPNGERVIQKIRRVSKPGRRIYSKARDLKTDPRRTGNLDHQHQPRRGERPRSAAAQPGRRSSL
jgi:ribosomal protein S8